MLAADHVINESSAFCEAVKNSIPLAEDGHVVTFGIIPEYAETGYGYIERGLPLEK